MPNWVDLMVAQERYNDMVRENEQDRRVAHMSKSKAHLSLWQRLMRRIWGGTQRKPNMRVLGANRRTLSIHSLHEPPKEETSHYLN